jgi:hypothetical protein
VALNDVQFNLLNNDMRYSIVLDDTHYINMNDIAIKAVDGSTRSLIPADVKVSGSTDVAIDHKAIN